MINNKRDAVNLLQDCMRSQAYLKEINTSEKFSHFMAEVDMRYDATCAISDATESIEYWMYIIGEAMKLLITKDVHLTQNHVDTLLGISQFFASVLHHSEVIGRMNDELFNLRKLTGEAAKNGWDEAINYSPFCQPVECLPIYN